MVGNMVRPVIPWEWHVELSYWIRESTVWNSMMMDKAVYKITEDSYDRSIVWREGESDIKSKCLFQ